MEKSITGLAIVLMVLTLLLGSVLTYAFLPRQVLVKPDKCEPVDCKAVDCKPVACTPANCTEVLVPSVLDKAVATFMEAVDKEEDEAGNEIDLQEGYDFDQISISKISKNWDVAYTKDTTEVGFSITLKYDEKGDSERSEKITYNVRVTYETDEDTIVEILE